MTTENSTQNDQRKNFSIKPSEDPDRLLAIHLRERACDDPNLSDGAVRLFVRLLDLALNPFLNNGKKGKVIISQADLGKLIHCTQRSIRRRTMELIAGNFIWTSLMPRRNTKPISVYHVTEFYPKRQAQQDVPGEGVLVNGKRRFDTGFEKTGKEAGGRHRPMVSSILDRHGRQIFFNLPQNDPENGQKRPFTPDTSVRGERTVASPARGHLRPVSEDTNVLSERSKLSGDSGQKRPVSRDVSGLLTDSQIEPQSQKRDLKRLNGEKKVTVSSLQMEDRLLSSLKDVCVQYPDSQHELETNGGNWRLRIRADRDKYERCLADVWDQHRRGTVKTTPAKLMEDNWKRFASRKAVAK